MISPRAREIAELLKMNMPPSAGREVIISSRYAAFVGRDPSPARNAVQRLRLRAFEVALAVEDIRAIFRERGRSRVLWEIGPSSTPDDLHGRLLAFGMVPFAPEPLLAGMVLARPLPSAATVRGVTVTPVRTPEDFHTSERIYHACFNQGEPEPSPEATAKVFAEQRDNKAFARYLARIDGEPVASASACFLEGAVVLGGGATLPEARGKGAYLSLIAARWEDGVARGTPVLVTQAGAMSRPILERLGFEVVAEVRLLLDTFA